MRLFWLLFVAVFVPMSLAHAAEGVLYVTPERNVYTVGEIFQIRVFADTGGAAINAAEANLAFDPSTIETQGVSTAASILQSWPAPASYSNEKATVRFAGVAHEKYTGSDGLLITVTFRTLRSATGAVRLTDGAILAEDVRGSNIIASMRSAAFTIQPRETVPSAPAVVDSDTLFVAESTATSETAASVLRPVFTEYPREVDVGERVIVKGVALADATVSVWLQRGEDDPKRADIMSSADGSFTYVSDSGAQSGTYRLWAQAVDQSGVRTATSSVITITVAPSSALTASAALTSNLVSGYLPYLAGLLALGLGIGFVMRRRESAAE